MSDVAEKCSFEMEEKRLESSRGDDLHCRYWKPPVTDIRALCFLSHGYGEHLGLNYGDLAEFLASRGILVFGHDHVGHGKSSGKRVQIRSPDDYVANLLEHSKLIKDKYGGTNRKLFVMGHSMGGLIAIASTFHDSEGVIDGGLVLVGPAISVDPEIATPFNLFLAKVGNYVAPEFQVSGVPLEKVTRDRERLRLIREDPLHWHGGLKLRHSYLVFQALNEIVNNFPNIKLPLLIQHGQEDRIVSPEGSQSLFDAVSSEDKTLKFYPEAFHHLYIELPDVQDEVINDTYSWINQRI